MKALLLAGSPASYHELQLARRRDDLEIRHIPALPAVGSLERDRAVVLLVDDVLLASVVNPERWMAELARVCAIVVRGGPGELVPGAAYPAGVISAFFASDAGEEVVRLALESALRQATVMRDERAARGEAERRHRDLVQLAEIGVALATERNLSRLLGQILAQARRLTSCDAATLYLVERRDDGSPSSLRVKMTQNQSRPTLAFDEFTLPLDSSSLAGHVASTGEALSIPDVAHLSPSLPYASNRTIDSLTGYQTRSMLVLPLVSHREEIVGVLQLINRKRDAAVLLTGPESVAREVIPFTLEALEPATALAAHAAVAIENGLLHESIESLFEGLVTAAVEAIDARDPSTAGHSSRVAALTIAFANRLASIEQGPYAGVHFSTSELRELRYAALLHDFGKVGVREEILLKGRKLHEADMQRVRHRIELLVLAEDGHHERLRAEWLLANGRRGYDERAAQLDATRTERQAFLREFLRRVELLNEGRLRERDDAVRRLLAQRFEDGAGETHALLQANERAMLEIQKGTLSAAERHELEEHVVHTDRFLRRIPWTRELSLVPEIAFAHHEKLNGVGYPRGVRGDAIPLRSRLITIADVFDALTSGDRSYKDAVPVERALDILESEGLAGELDLELLRVFREGRVWETQAKPVQAPEQGSGASGGAPGGALARETRPGARADGRSRG